MLIAFNKPFRVLCQFTDTQDRATLADFIDLPGVYAAGRLDHDSEGLLLLTDDGRLQKRIADPEHGLVKRYLAEVEGDVAAQALANLASRVQLRDGPARALTACRIETPALWPRDPPVRFRRHIPTTWIANELDKDRDP